MLTAQQALTQIQALGPNALVSDVYVILADVDTSIGGTLYSLTVVQVI